MIKRHFDYVRAESCAEAVELLADASRVCRPLAGGTDLLAQAYHGQVNWDRLVDVSRIPELIQITHAGDAILLGAGTTHTQAWQHPLIRQHLPLLAEACHAIGSPPIRNRGTVGGNVANAAPCADTVPALVCLEAVALVMTGTGEVELPVSKAVLGPNRNALPPGGLIRVIRLPMLPSGCRMSYIKIGRRQAQAISRLSLACLGWLDADGCVAEVRIVPGACTPQTSRFDRAEAVLRGQRPSEALVREAGARAAEQMVELAGRRWSTAYKEGAIGALVERGLRQVFDLPAVD